MVRTFNPNSRAMARSPGSSSRRPEAPVFGKDLGSPSPQLHQVGQSRPNRVARGTPWMLPEGELSGYSNRRGIDPQDAGASGRGDARDRTDRHGGSPPQRWGSVATDASAWGVQPALTSAMAFAKAGLLGIQLVAFGDFDVAEIRDGVSRCRRAGPRPA